MGFDIGRIKSNARAHYENNKWNNVLVALIWVIVPMVLSTVMSVVYIVGVLISAAAVVPEFDNGDTETALLKLLGTNIVSVLFMCIISYATVVFVTNVINMGIITWFRKSIHTTGCTVSEIFVPFKRKYTDNVLTMFLKTLFIGLWSLLFVVPGLVKFYSYFAVEYIKDERPDMPAMKALELSERMMNGHKADVFLLSLSFIGWMLLAVYTANIAGVLYVYPYYYAAMAFAYEEIKADAIASGRISDAEFA